VSSVAQQQGVAYSPAEVRSLLMSTGTAQDTSTDTSPIGPLPNLEAALDEAFIPDADAGGPYSVAEASNVTLTGSGTDPQGSPLTYEWDLDNDGQYDDATGTTAVFHGVDDGTYIVGLRVTDPAGASGTDTATVTVNNVPPTVGAITAPSGPLSIGTSINASAAFSDPGTLDTFTAAWSWGDGTTTSIPLGAGSTSTNASHTYTTGNIYTITLTVTDDDGGSGSSVFKYVIVFDPTKSLAANAKIVSPPAAYIPNAAKTGDALSSAAGRYKSGVPSGGTTFQFNAVPFSFNATSFQWVVVTTSGRGYMQGAGLVNGVAGYSFLLSVVDGVQDKFRFKVWNTATSIVVYDSQFGAPLDAAANISLVFGSVVLS
jgi:PKD repeat protein